MNPTTFLLVRHAHAEWVPDEMRPLSARGLAQAGQVAEILSPLRPVAIYSSPYRRAHETVEPLSALVQIPIQEMLELRERSLGSDWEEDWSAVIRRTWEDFTLAFPGAGETNAQALARARVAFEILRSRHPGETIVIATHGNLLVLLLRTLDSEKGFEFWSALSLPDIYRLDLNLDGSFELRRLWTQLDPS